MSKSEDFLPYAKPLLGLEEAAEVLDTLKSGWLSRGPRCTKFEQRILQFVGTKYAVAVNSCTAALFLALKAMGVGPGDEVITTPLTFIATANVIVHTGARPVFADVEPQTLNINAGEVAKKVSPRTRVIIPVHYAGQACDMDAILNLAQSRGLRVLEDAAHAICTTYKGRMVGSIGDATAFSFYATKNLVTGEGGMLTTDNEELANRVRILSLHGMDNDAWKRYSAQGSWFYEVLLPGYKCNMTDLQAALGLKQLERIEAMQALRRQYAAAYNNGLANLPGITLPRVANDGGHAWHLYVIQVDEKEAGISRERFIEEMKKKGIGTSVHFIPVHLHTYYKNTYGYKEGDFPVAEKAFKKLVSLPLYPRMTMQEVQKVIKAVRDIVGIGSPDGGDES